jgi:small subunit ribosomal protein S17
MDAKNRPLSIRGFVQRGIVVSDKAKNTVIVERDATRFIAKYKRYARAKSRIPAHKPDEIKAEIGDEVEISECRKISKTKSWIVTKVIAKGVRKGELIREEKLEHMAKQSEEKESPAAHAKKETKEKE